MRLHERDDDVRAAVASAAALAQHRVGLADAGSGAEVEPKGAARCHPRSEADLSRGVEGEVEREHVHARLAHEAERPVVGLLVDELEHAAERQAALARDPRRLQARVRRRDVGIEPGAEAVTASTGTSLPRPGR